MAAVTGFRVLARDRMAPDLHVQRGEDEVQDRILDWDHSEGTASTGRGDPGSAMGKKPRQDSSAVMCEACGREAQPVVRDRCSVTARLIKPDQSRLCSVFSP